jgi:hypothetical protein
MSTIGRQSEQNVESETNTTSKSSALNNNTNKDKSKTIKENLEIKTTKSSTSSVYKNTIGGQLKLKGVVLKTTGKR